MIPMEVRLTAGNLFVRTDQFIEDYNEGRDEFFRMEDLMSLLNEIDDFLRDLYD
jgi:hypothetical protein